MTVRSIAEALLVQAQEAPDAPAFIHGSSNGPIALSWRELASAAAHHIATLDKSGFKHGDRVLTAIPNSLTWILTDLACQLRGWVHVAVDPQLPASRVDAVIHQTTPRAVIRRPVEPDDLLMDRMKSSDPALPVPSPAIDIEDAAQILFTSGTTGAQKGVVLSHRNLLSNAAAKLEAAPQFQDDLRLNILPFSHAYARTCELSSWILSGCSMAIARDWNHFCRMASELQPTLINLVPHLVDRAQQHIVANRNTSIRDAAAELWGRKLRLLQVGGAALRAETWNFFAALGLPPLQGYGLTETSPVICSNRAGEQRCGTVGSRCRNPYRRRNDFGRVARTSCARLLAKRLEATQGVRLVDGWLNTGDLAEPDPTVPFVSSGRADDVLVLSTRYRFHRMNCCMIGDAAFSNY
ncbi:MAG: long-chain fatty acid--CoA ligase [Pirellulales bacterium]